MCGHEWVGLPTETSVQAHSIAHPRVHVCSASAPDAIDVHVNNHKIACVVVESPDFPPYVDLGLLPYSCARQSPKTWSFSNSKEFFFSTHRSQYVSWACPVESVESIRPASHLVISWTGFWTGWVPEQIPLGLENLVAVDGKRLEPALCG